MTRKKHKAEHVADTRGKGWTGIPHAVMDSLAYQQLSMDARSILFEIVRKFNGYNNGKIGIGYREFAARLNRKGFHFIAPAIGELIEHGLVDVTAAQSWVDKRVREYRLTFITTAIRGHLGAASNEYLDWRISPSKPKRKSGRKSSFCAGSVETDTAACVGIVETVPHGDRWERGNGDDGKLPHSPILTVGSVAPLIDSHTPIQNSGAEGTHTTPSVRDYPADAKCKAMADAANLPVYKRGAASAGPLP